MLIKALAIVLHIQLSAAVITACPSTVTTYTDTNGAKYAICTGSDYQGTSLVVTANVASATACALQVSRFHICNSTTGTRNYCLACT